MKITKALVTLAVVVAFIATLSVFSFAQDNSPRITQQIDDGKVVRLYRNTRPEANFKNDRGPVSDSLDMDHILLLLQRSPDQEQELQKLIDEMNDRNSPNFHKWLTAEEFGRYGVAQEDIDQITGWLEYHGFRINQVHASHMVIDISGSAGAVREAFHTEIHNLDVNGQPHIANMTDPQIPAALAQVVKGPVSLNDFKPHANFELKPDYTITSGSTYALTPQDNAVIYNLNPLWTAGYSGQGQTIALVEDADTYTPSGKTNAADWNTYRTSFGLTSYSGTFSVVHPTSCTDPGVNAASLEAALDVEVATGVAPSAAIELISCADTNASFGGMIAMINMLNAAGPYPGVMSMSYGSCEADNGSVGNAVFYNTFQQAAAQGVSVFASSGDNGPSQCSADFLNSQQTAELTYQLASLGITGWGETPYNVSVGGTDFEDTYNSKEINSAGGWTATVPLTTYWNATNGSTYGSAKSYIPEIPWNDSCGSILLAETSKSTFTTYGSTGFCNESPGDTTYLSQGAGAGGASNCATGSAGTNQTSDLISSPECQGWPKPSWQSVYGNPTDGVRDIPDVAMFAANGDFGHYEIICFSDTAEGGASCSGAPSTWTGLGGTSVASPTMAAIQALVNQKTGEAWGNVAPIYYSIGQSEYGTQGGTFTGSSCNSDSSAGVGSSCVFNDVTQGDIDGDCEYNGTLEEAHCYKPSGTYGVDSTDVITAATVINGGSGYTSAPTCTIAGPSNNNPYKTPTGTTLWAGGTQAACTAAVNSGTTTAAWTVALNSTYANSTYMVSGAQGITIGATTYTFVTTPAAVNQIALASSYTNLAKNIEATINATSSQCGTTSCYYTGQTANSLATATVSSGTVTLTAKSAGYAGNFNVALSGSDFSQNASIFFTITNTTAGQGPNYVSGITITTAGTGYGPETPITLTGAGSGAVAVANTSYSTAASAYEPAYGAAPGWDMATGLGSPNANNLVNSSAWLAATSTAVSSSLNPSNVNQSVSFTATITATNLSYTKSAPTGTVQFYIDGVAFGSPVTVASNSATSGSTSTLTAGTHTVTATYSGDKANATSTGTLSGGQVVNKLTTTTGVSSSLNPSTYGQSVSFTAAVSGGSSPSGTVQFYIDSTAFGSAVTLSSGSATSGSISTLAVGNHTVTATYSGDTNNSGSTGTLSGGQTVGQAGAGTITVSLTSGTDPSTYGQSLTFTASIPGQYGQVKGRNPNGKGGIKPETVTGTVTWSPNTGCSPTTVTPGTPGTATCTTSILPVGTSDTVTANYGGDSNHSSGSGSVSQQVNQVSSSTGVSSS
ncbi:MAG: Ig-like domain repeat protein, partial [Terriglobales bacterium]